MGNNRSFKCCSLFMAVIILIQGCVYLGLSIWGIKLSECSNTTPATSTEPIKLIVELVYFKKDECGPLVFQSNLTEDSLELNIAWNKSDKITNRTFIILISYAVVSSLWILTSLLVISSICGPLNKLVVAICFWPWFLAVLAGSVLDLVATGYHLNDLLNTMSIENALDYIGILGDESKEILRPLGMLLMGPALILTCLSSRFILIWFLNTFGSCVCISLYQKVAPTKRSNINDRQSVSRNSANEAQAAQASSKNDKLKQFTQSLKSCHLQSPTKISHDKTVFVTEKQIATDTADDAIAVISKTITSEEQTSQDPSKYDNWEKESTSFHLAKNASNNRNKTLVVTNNKENSEPADDVIMATSSQLRRIPSKLNVNNNLSSDISRMRPMHAHKDQPIIHPNMYPRAVPNTRYITPNEYYPPYTPNARVNELRGQLPWSYTNMPNEASRVNIYPDIPTPDY